MFNTYEKLIQGLLDKGYESVDNWFDSKELACLRKSLLMHRENEDFHSAGIGNKENLQTIRAIRNDHIYWLDPTKANECEKKALAKIDEFVLYLNRTCFTAISSYEFQYAIYNKGAFYKKHIDQFVNDNKRLFSVVFYLSESWKNGDGGELLLYTNNSVSRITPIPGRMIFFKSDIPHEVLTSNNTRLSLTGWLKSN